MIAESEEKDGDRSVDEFNNFELSLIGIEDKDGSQRIGMDSLNLDSGLLSLVESSKGFQTGLTSSAEMILATSR
ncbi:MAG: hypothetical protein CL859_04885 [Cyanobium sp. ARS6]|nr:hypothetical protein [Cyanobium sp. ARS6]